MPGMGEPVGRTSSAEDIGNLDGGAHRSGGGWRLDGDEDAQTVERTGDGPRRAGCHLGIERCRLELAMPEQHLDDADIDTVLQQMDGEAVPQRMRPTRLAMPVLPPLAQQGEQVGRKHRIAVSPALAALDTDQHALAVDIAHLEHGDLADAQSGAIGDRQRCLVLEAGGCVEQASHLVAAQHHRQVARLAHPHQLASQIGSVKGIGKEEPQRRTTLFMVGTGTPAWL